MKLTKGDKILVILLVVFSIVFAFTSFFNTVNKGSEKFVSIQINGKEIKSVKLSKDIIGKTYEIETEFGRNVLQFGDGEVKIIEASCLDKLCIEQGTIKNVGQLLVCLPNRLVVEIKSMDQSPNLPEIDNATF